MDHWLDKAREITDDNEREKLYYRVVDQTLEDSRQIFHVNVNYTRLWKKGLVGYKPSPQEYVELFSSVKWEG